jgi:ribosomal protein S2
MVRKFVNEKGDIKFISEKDYNKDIVKMLNDKV